MATMLNAVLIIINILTVSTVSTSKAAPTSLYEAAIAGDTDLISNLLPHRTFSIDTPNDKDETALYLALKYNQTEAARLLIENCANVNIRLSNRQTLLHLASARGELALAETLIQRYGLSVNQTDVNTKTALHYAAEGGHLELVRLLIDHNVRTEYITDEVPQCLPQTLQNKPHSPFNIPYRGTLEESFARGLVYLLKNHEHINLQRTLYSVVEQNTMESTFLYNLIKRDYRSTIEYLFSNQTHTRNYLDLTQKVDSWDYTLLHYCAMVGNHEVAKIVLDHGANVSAETIWSRTPLDFAVENGHTNVVKELLLRRGPRKCKDSNASKDAKVLSEALNNNHAEVVYCLLSAGFNLQKSIKFLLNTFQFKFFENANLNLTKLVLRDEVNVREFQTRMDSNSEFPSWIYNAVSSGNLRIIKYMMEELRIPLMDNDTDFYVAAAAEHCDLDIIDYLVAHGALQLELKNGKTLLYYAARAARLDLIHHLVMHYDLDLAKHSSSDHLIEGAIRSNSTELYRYLIDKGATLQDLTVKGLYPGWANYTPLLCAISNGNLELVSSLLDAHAQKGFQVGVIEVLKAVLGLRHERLDIIKLIIAKTNTSALAHDNSILFSVSCDRLKIVRYLIDVVHMDYRKARPRGGTPLEYAAYLRCVPLVKLLMERLSSDDATGSPTRTPTFDQYRIQCLLPHMTTTYNACYSGGNMLKYLIFKYRNTSAHAQSIVHTIASLGNLHQLKQIAQYGVDFSVLDSQGHTPLYLAAQNGHVHVVKWLMCNHKCANIEHITEEYRMTVLDMLAAHCPHSSSNNGYMFSANWYLNICFNYKYSFI